MAAENIVVDIRRARYQPTVKVILARLCALDRRLVSRLNLRGIKIKEAAHVAVKQVCLKTARVSGQNRTAVRVVLSRNRDGITCCQRIAVSALRRIPTFLLGEIAGSRRIIVEKLSPRERG